MPNRRDTIVHRAYERVLGELGVDLRALGEVEYFLGKRASDEDVYGVADSGYHASSPFVFGEALRREALVLLADMGVPIKYGHSEVGAIDTRPVDGMIWEQHEIELLLTPLPRAADSVMLTRWVLQNLARRQGFQCTFAPVVREGHAGNGLHFHFSPRVDGEHMGGMDEHGSLAPSAQWLIGGLVQFGGALMAFGNREHTSFLRLTQGKEAPTSVTWGRFDRAGAGAAAHRRVAPRRAAGDSADDRVPPGRRLRAPAPPAGGHRAGDGAGAVQRGARRDPAGDGVGWWERCGGFGRRGCRQHDARAAR